MRRSAHTPLARPVGGTKTHRHLPGRCASRITRRRLLRVGGAGLVTFGVAGCSGSTGNEYSGRTRRVESPMGPVELPVEPQKLVAMYSVDVDVALVLDLPLVGGGTAAGGADQAFASHQPEKELEGVEKLQTYPEANYEQIAAVGPDCIVDSTTDGRKQYDRLSEIAPTFNYHRILYKGENYTAHWEDGLRRVAEVFGRETRAMPETIEGRPNLSLERLDLLEDADFLFMRVEAAMEDEGRDRQVLDDLQDSPLWRRLPAVRKGKVVEYDAELYYASPLTAETFLDVVESALLER